MRGLFDDKRAADMTEKRILIRCGWLVILNLPSAYLSAAILTRGIKIACRLTARIARQKEIDASIAAKAEFKYLYERPYAGNRKVRVAGPFTVEGLSPHRVPGVDENDELIDGLKEDGAESGIKLVESARARQFS